MRVCTRQCSSYIYEYNYSIGGDKNASLAISGAHNLSLLLNMLTQISLKNKQTNGINTWFKLLITVATCNFLLYFPLTDCKLLFHPITVLMCVIDIYD